jgi:hypothetical protein
MFYFGYFLGNIGLGCFGKQVSLISAVLILQEQEGCF